MHINKAVKITVGTRISRMGVRQDYHDNPSLYNLVRGDEISILICSLVKMW